LLISLLGTFYGLIKDYDQATSFQKIAIEKAPFESSFYRNLSETLKNMDKIKDALSTLYFNKILSLNDKSIDYEIAKLNTALSNYLAADLIYKRLMTEENVNKDVKYSYCSNLIKLNKVNEAIKNSKVIAFDDYYISGEHNSFTIDKYGCNELIKSFHDNEIFISPPTLKFSDVRIAFWSKQLKVIEDLKKALL